MPSRVAHYAFLYLVGLLTVLMAALAIGIPVLIGRDVLSGSYVSLLIMGPLYPLLVLIGIPAISGMWWLARDAGAESRTRTAQGPRDFESRASTSSATPANEEANP